MWMVKGSIDDYEFRARVYRDNFDHAIVFFEVWTHFTRRYKNSMDHSRIA